LEALLTRVENLRCSVLAKIPTGCEGAHRIAWQSSAYRWRRARFPDLSQHVGFNQARILGL